MSRRIITEVTMSTKILEDALPFISRQHDLERLFFIKCFPLQVSMQASITKTTKK